MKSSIKIAVDDSMQRVIEIIHENSDDVRDHLIGDWVQFRNVDGPDLCVTMEFKEKKSVDGKKVYHLRPVRLPKLAPKTPAAEEWATDNEQWSQTTGAEGECKCYPKD